ncbi:Uncharacterized protein APZ42_005351, partial [Daphnia magna]
CCGLTYPDPSYTFTPARKRDKQVQMGYILYFPRTNVQPSTSPVVCQVSKESSSLSPTHPRPLWQ